ncbi:MAG: hypothetical protein PGN11_03640 [Quadrisphaera sp.]
MLHDREVGQRCIGELDDPITSDTPQREDKAVTGGDERELQLHPCQREAPARVINNRRDGLRSTDRRWVRREVSERSRRQRAHRDGTGKIEPDLGEEFHLTLFGDTSLVSDPPSLHTLRKEVGEPRGELKGSRVDAGQVLLEQEPEDGTVRILCVAGVEGEGDVVASLTEHPR